MQTLRLISPLHALYVDGSAMHIYIYLSCPLAMAGLLVARHVTCHISCFSKPVRCAFWDNFPVAILIFQRLILKVSKSVISNLQVQIFIFKTDKTNELRFLILLYCGTVRGIHWIGLDWNSLTKFICISCSNIAIVPARCVPPGGVIMLFVVNPALWTQLPVLL